MNTLATHHYNAESCEWETIWSDPGWQISKSIGKLTSMAKDFGVTEQWAVEQRLAFVKDEVEAIQEIQKKKQIHLADLYLGPDSPWMGESLEQAIIIAQARDDLHTIKKQKRVLEIERNNLMTWLEIKNGRKKVNPDSLTDAQEDEARNFPIEDLIRGADINISKSGMLKCPFHDDKSESASIKRGVLYCFAGCRPGPEGNGKDYWDGIGFYRKYYGVGYVDAVKGILGLR